MQEVKDVLFAIFLLLAGIAVVIGAFYMFTVGIPILLAIGAIVIIVQLIQEERNG